MTILSYHDEDGAKVLDEMKALFDAHYDELCVTKEFELDPNYDEYERLIQAKMLRFITCRIDGEIIGYVVFIIQPHLHYKTCLTAFEDIYFIKKEYRRGRIGIKMFQYAERVLKERGINRIIYGTKVHLDNSRLFEYLGYKHTDKVFTKLL
jgi:GNAT superfamily N-acetyltransferase